MILQPRNCLLVGKYTGNPKDRTLRNLIPFLIELSGFSDVRDVSKRYKEYLKNPKAYSPGAKGVTNFKESIFSFFSKKDDSEERKDASGKNGEVSSFSVNKSKIEASQKKLFELMKGNKALLMS